MIAGKRPTSGPIPVVFSVQPHRLSATPIPDSNVIELRAEGGNGELLTQLLTVWIDAYRRSQSDSFDRSSTAALEEARYAGEIASREEAISLARSLLI